MPTKPTKPKCELCQEYDREPQEATHYTIDKTYLCDECAKDVVEICASCGCEMVWSVTVYYGVDGKTRCQLCDMEFEDSPEANAYYATPMSVRDARNPAKVEELGSTPVSEAYFFTPENFHQYATWEGRKDGNFIR